MHRKKKISAKNPVFNEKELRKTARKVLGFLKIKNAALDVFLLENRAMRDLERKFAGKNKKFVEVLSFEPPEKFPHPESRRRSLGEVYLNSEIGDRVRLERLLVHGILHLLGFDHGRKSDMLKMDVLEKEVLRVLNSKNRK